MNRTKFLDYYAIFCISSYILFIGSYFLIFNQLFPLWFSLAVLLTASWCFFKSIFFALDSTLWIALFLLYCSGLGFYNYFVAIPQENIVGIYVLGSVFACLIVSMKYKIFLLLKISFGLLLEVFLILLYSNKILSLNIFLFVNLLLLLIIGGYYVFRAIKRV